MLKKLDQLKTLKSKLQSGKKSEDEYIVGLDIGTENVKALIARVVGDDLEIVGVGRAHQSLSDMQAGAIADIAGVVSNCDKALAEAEKEAGITPRTAVIGIAGELVKGTTTTVRCTRQNPKRPLDIAEVERIITIVQERAEAKARKELTFETGGKSVEIRLVNSALVNIDIDGYTVTNPVGFQGKEVVVQLYTAFAPLIHIGALEKTAQELDLDLLAVAAEPFAVARAIIGNDPNASMSAILMDIGGGTTDIAVVNEGGVQGTKMFGIGGRAYTKSIERETEGAYERAEKLKLAYADDSLSGSQKATVEKALKKTLAVWRSGVELALADFTRLDSMPHQIFLCGGGSSLDLVLDELEKSNWHKSLPFTRNPIVKRIVPSQVSGIEDMTDRVHDHTFITAMGLLRVGADTLNQESGRPAGSIREKIDRMLRV